jgi:protease IV
MADRCISPATIHKPLKFYRTSAISPPPSSSIIDRLTSSAPIHLFSSSSGKDVDYPTGDFDFIPHSGLKKYLVQLKTLLALPSEGVKNGSVLQINLSGIISDTLHTDSEVLSLPQICDNLLKAMYDPRIYAVYLNIQNLNTGWGKLDEIRRQILNFRKSGKLIFAYVPEIGVKEYYVATACKEIYAHPFVEVHLYGPTVDKFSFIKGVYHNFDFSHETTTALMDNIYSNWLDVVSSSTGKKRENVENLVNFVTEGVYQVEDLKEEGFITDLLYMDDIITYLKERLGVRSLPFVSFKEYSRVSKSTVGISRAEEELIAIIRVSGSISSATEFIENIYRVRASTEFKAVIVRIDSSGGKFRASNYMWREMKRLAAEIPVIASISDVATSAGYYLATGAGAIVAENLTLVGSFSPNNRSFSKSMEEVPQGKGKVWTGKDATSLGLVDAIGGLSRAIAIAKSKANIPQNGEVTLVELSTPCPTLPWEEEEFNLLWKYNPLVHPNLLGHNLLLHYS